MTTEIINQLENLLGYKFLDCSLLIQALTRRSYTNEHPDVQHNERLEFLGDAVLELIVSRKLYFLYPDADEGTLTKMRVKLVNTINLAKIARDLNLGDFIRMSIGEEEQGNRTKDTVLCNVFESILGSLFLDGTIGVVSEFLERVLFTTIDLDFENSNNNYKTQLQEVIQSKFHILPKYLLLKCEDFGNEKRFTVLVSIPDAEFTGVGTSRKRAEQAAAQLAFEHITSKQGGE